MYNTGKQSNLSIAGSANAAVKAANLLMAPKDDEEEEDDDEEDGNDEADGTQEQLPDEAFPEIPDSAEAGCEILTSRFLIAVPDGADVLKP